MLWAVWADLFCLRIERAFWRLRLRSLHRKIYRSYKQAEYDISYQCGEMLLEIAEEVGEYPAKSVALFACHQIMGFICCIREDWDKAADHLVCAVDVKECSTLRMLYPWLALPKELIEKGYAQSVSLYLDHFGDWWCCGAPLSDELCEQRTQALHQWKRKVRKGRVPTQYPWPKEEYKYPHQRKR